VTLEESIVIQRYVHSNHNVLRLWVYNLDVFIVIQPYV